MALSSFISDGLMEWHAPATRAYGAASSPDHSSLPYVMTELAGEFDEGGLRPTERGLAVADALLPRLLRTA